jgi:hypothetical protein
MIKVAFHLVPSKINSLLMYRYRTVAALGRDLNTLCYSRFDSTSHYVVMEMYLKPFCDFRG